MSAGLHHATRWCCRKDLNLQLHGSQPGASASCATTATCLNWYRRRDSNPHCLVPKTSASSRLGYAGMVNPAGLEPATCRLGNDCSNPTELRVLSLVAETGLEPVSTDYESVPGGFTTPVYSASNFSNWLRR